MLKDFLKDLIKYIPSKVIPGILGVILIPVMTRLFEPNEYGNYVIVITTVSVLSIIGFDWIGPSITRFYAEYQRDAKGSLLFNGTVIRLSISSIIVIGLTSFIIILFCKPMFKENLYYYLNVGLVIFCVGVAFNAMSSILYVARRVKLYSFFSVWRQSGCVLIGILMVATWKLGVGGLLWGSVIGIVVMLPILFKLSVKQFRIKNYSKGLGNAMMGYGFPLIATNLAAWALALSDRFIIGHFRGSYEVGLYSISYSIADNSIKLIESLIVLASAPIVMEIWETRGVEDTRLFIHDMTKYYLIITLPATIGLIMLSEPLVKVLTTSGFHRGYVIMPMVAASVFVLGLQRSFQLGLLFYKKTSLIMYILILSGVINVMLNLLLVPKYGFVAAGYNILFSYLCFMIMMIYVSRKYFVWKFPFRTLLNSSVAAIFMSLFVHVILNVTADRLITGVVLSIVIGSAAYFGCLVLTGEIKRDVFSRLQSLLGKDKPS
jgi:O-antigen/teichoic acid export membrane protein